MHAEVSALCCHRALLCRTLHATVDGRQRLICNPAIVPAATPVTTACFLKRVPRAAVAAAMGSHAARRHVWTCPNLPGGKPEPFTHRTHSNAFRHAGDASQQVRNPDGSGGALTAKLVATCSPHNTTPPRHTACAFAAYTSCPSAVLYTAAYTQAHAAACCCRGYTHHPTCSEHLTALHQPSVHQPSLL